MVTFPEVPLGIFLFCMCVIAIGVVQVGRRALLCLGAQLWHVLGPPLRGHADHGLGPLLRGRADRASQGVSAPGTRLGPEPPSCCGWRMRWGLAPSGWAETSRGARARPTRSLQRLPQALIVLYAFHFPHLLSPQIERSAHRGLYRQHILGIIMRGPVLCLAAAGFSLFFYPAVSPGPARSCHGTHQRAWDAWPYTCMGLWPAERGSRERPSRARKDGSGGKGGAGTVGWPPECRKTE